MTSQIRVDEITNRSGLGTVTIYDNGFEFTGVTTFTEDVDITGGLTIGGVLTYEDVTNVDSVGVVTARAGVKVPDSQKIFLGTGNDLEIYHDGNNSAINDKGTGNLYIQGSSNIYIRDYDTSESHIIMTKNGSVELYHDGSKKLETTLSGVAIHEDTDKVVRFTGAIGEIGDVTGFQASNTAGSALTDFGMRATTLRFATGSAERLRITSSGFIGAGTANPRRHFHLHNSATATVGFQMTNGGTGESNDSQGFQLKVASDGHAEIAQMENSNLRIFTNASERLRIRSDGKISTGTNLDTNNSYEFSIRGADGTGSLYAHGRNHYLSTRSTSHSSLTLKKSNSDSDGVDYLQLRDSANAYLSGFSGAGNLKPASGKGIDFSNNSHAGGMTSEILDDYEEGTSTVSIQHITADTNQVYMTYTKIGSLVSIVGVITITNKTASSGTNGWFHLPFAPSSHNTSKPGCDIQMNTINTGVAYLGFYGNNTNCYFMSRSGSYQSGNSLGNGKIGFTATYTTH